MKIYFATRVRSFFKHLFAESEIKAKISYSNTSIYELNGKKEKLARRLAKFPLFDILGIIKTIRIKDHDCDMYGSFNRFLNADKPYFIYVENPTALYHYRLQRGTSFLGRKKIYKGINDEKLKAIVCMSRACERTFEKLCCNVPESKILTQIYPLVPDNPYVEESVIKNRCAKSSNLRLLYVCQGIRFFSKGGLEIIEAFKQLQKNGCKNLSLTMVTSFSDISPAFLKKLSRVDGIKLLDFNLSNDEMQKLYANHSIYLMPTSDDSYNLTVLEAIKAGLPVIGCSLYAIPEMVENNYNGYLTAPAYYFFDKDCMPNPRIWNNRKATIYSGKCDERIKKFLCDKIAYLNSNRVELYDLSINSLKKAYSSPFSREHIVKQWNEIFQVL